MSNYTSTPTASTYKINSDLKTSYGGTLAGCGVYLMDSNLTTDGTAASEPFPVCCSINTFSKVGNYHDKADAIIIYPGFKVVCDETTLFDTNTWPKYTIDNTNGTEIIIRTFQNINSISGIKVYYLNNEIVLDGITNNINPPVYPP
jgi:hypothetical protein